MIRRCSPSALQAVTPITDRSARYFFATGPASRRDVDAFSTVANAAFLGDKEIIEAHEVRLDDDGPDMLIVGADYAVVQFLPAGRKDCGE